MPNKSKSKGSAYERELAKLLTSTGFPAQRVVGSGALGVYNSSLQGDVVQDFVEGTTLKLEVKYRRNGSGFAQLEKWLGQGGADMLALRRANEPWLFIVPEKLWIEVLTLLAEKTNAG